MRRQYKYNQRTDNNQFERKELITRLDNNCVSSLCMVVTRSSWASDIGMAFLNLSKNCVGCTSDLSCSSVVLSAATLDADKTAIYEFKPLHLCSSWRGLCTIHSSPSRGALTVRISPVCENENIPGTQSAASSGQLLVTCHLLSSMSCV
jgi:hypothetical protein